jgi:hypothetical protein
MADCSPTELLQAAHDLWIDIEEMIHAADVIANDVNPHDSQRVLTTIVRTLYRMSERMGDDLARAVIANGGRA